MSVTLVLPLPPSPNRWARHPMMLHREKVGYQREAWLAAVQQEKPKADPPPTVEVHAVLRLCRKRDADNATASVKWALDALRQKQTGELRWREGIATNKGYFYDDGPEYLRLEVSQEKVKQRVEERLEVTVSRWLQGEDHKNPKKGGTTW